MSLYKLLFSAVLSLQLISVSFAQTSHWSDVPELVSSSMENFRSIFRNARTQGTGITILGDSQETSPGGAGVHYVPSLGHEFFKFYGNVPRSGLVVGRSQASAWLSSASTAGTLSFDGINSLTEVGTYGNAPPNYGLLAQLATDGYTTPFLDVPDGGYFNGNDVEAELIVRARPGSGEVYWRANLTDDDRRSYFGGEVIGSGTTNLNLDRSKVEFVSTSLGTFSLDDHTALQIVARGANDNATADIAGVRFHNAGDSSGISVQTFSINGGTARQFLDSSSADLGFFSLVAEDEVIAIQVGTNDAGRGLTAAGFKDDLEEMILALRAGTGNPELPIILISDPDVNNLTEERRLEYDLYPGVAAELAAEYSNVLALNTRLIGDRHNWTAGSDDFQRYTFDGVHYTQLGGTSLAQWQAESLLTLAVVPEPTFVLPGAICVALMSLRRRRNRI